MTRASFDFQRLVGRRIKRINRVLYEFAGQVEKGDGPLELVLDEAVILLDGASDGETLRVREQAWVDPFEGPQTEENRQYLEQHGRWRRIDCSRSEPYADLCGQEITDVCALTNEFGTVAGLRLTTLSRESLVRGFFRRIARILGEA